MPVKTKKGRRDLVMPASITSAMRDHRQRQVSAGKAAVGYVFTTSLGTPLEARNVVRGHKALLERAGLPDRRFHDLRHGAASLMLALGIPMKQVQKVLGHSSFQVTSDTYSHVLPELERDAAERMEAIFARH